MKFTPDVPIVPNKKDKESIIEPNATREVKPGLDSQTSQHVRDWSHAWLQDFYDKALSSKKLKDFIYKLDFSRDLEAEIATMVGESDSYNQRLLAPRYREGVSIFLNTLIDFIEDKSSDPAKVKKLQSFIGDLHEALFSFSPNIANHIGLENLLITTAKATRVPEAQGWFGQNMVGELTYELNWAHEESVELILNKIRKLGLSEQLDVIHQLATIGADAISQGEPGYNAHDRIVRMLEVINQESPYPIMGYATENALITIEREEENPSLSVITFQGNVAGARLPEELSEALNEQNETLKRQVRITNKDGKNYKMLPIASDAVGLFDHSNTPRQFAQLEIASLPKPAEINANRVEQLKEGAESKLDRNQFLKLLIYISEDIVLDRHNLEDSTPETLAEKWHKISSQFSKTEWRRIFAVLIKRVEKEDADGGKVAELREQTENENVAASNRFINLVIAKGKAIIDSLPNIPPILQEDYDALIKYSKAGNEERTFTSAEGFVRYFTMSSPDHFNLSLSNKEIPRHQNVDIKELQEALDALHKFHIDSWKSYTQAERELQSVEDDPSAEAALMEFVETRDKLIEKQAVIQADILKFLQSLDQKLGKELVAVEARPYRDIELDPNLNPFKGEDSEQLTLLLQSLHNPALRNFIETDLGISLAEIPLRSQIHLLRFLSGQNREGFDRLRNVLRAHPELTTKILNSFLACAEDMDYSEPILKLAEMLDTETTEAVFTKYNEITDASEQARKYILQILKDRKVNIDDVIKNLLHRGNELLKQWAKSLEKTNPADMLTDLARIKTEVQLLASTFLVASEDKDDPVKIDEIKVAQMEVRYSSSLTNEEKGEMERIFINNRKNYSKDLLDDTLSEFKSALISKDKEFQILKLGKDIIAFIRFDQLPNGNLYAGSLNVRPEIKGSAIGSAMLRATLDKKAESHDIEAVAYSKNPMLKHYTGSFGFEIVGEIPDYHGTGELYYKLLRRKIPTAK